MHSSVYPLLLSAIVALAWGTPALAQARAQDRRAARYPRG